MTLTLLVDGDINIYQACAVSEKEVVWDEEITTIWSYLDEVTSTIKADFDCLMRDFDADNLVIALSDTNRGRIFRRDLWPDYKQNRKYTRKPLNYWLAVNWVKDNYKTYERPNLEGDDVLGILATSSKIITGEKIVVSLDKDMKTVPCNYYRGGPVDDIYEVSESDADWWHMLQTLTGDTTDGYPGCPGIGDTSARKLLDDPRRLESYEHVFKSGPRKGKSEERWREGESCDVWTAIVDRYARAGLTEEDALVQARCARILRNTDYDFKKKEVRLWSPH